MISYLKNKCENVIIVDGGELCRKAGSPKVLNVALLGTAVGTGKTGLSRENVLEEIKHGVKEKFLELNINAFTIGEQIGASYEIK